MTASVNPINPKAYLATIAGGRYPYTFAPTTSWRQTIRAVDTQSAASVVSVAGTVEAIHDGIYEASFLDANGDAVVGFTLVTVGGGVPDDEEALATAIAAAIEGQGSLDGYVDSATSDGTEFLITFFPGMGLRVVLETGNAANDLTVSHSVEINLNTLNPRNAFPRYVTREADPYLLVTAEWPTDTVVTVDADGVVNSQVISQAPVDALGVVETYSATTLSASDMVEPAWEPVATFDLGDDPFPTDGALEVIVPFSPIFAPVRLP